MKSCLILTITLAVCSYSNAKTESFGHAFGSFAGKGYSHVPNTNLQFSGQTHSFENAHRYSYANGHHIYNESASSNPYAHQYHHNNYQNNRYDQHRHDYHHHDYHHHDYHHYHNYYRNQWIYDGDADWVTLGGNNSNVTNMSEADHYEELANEYHQKAEDARRNGKPDLYNRYLKCQSACDTIAKGYRYGQANLITIGKQQLELNK